MATRTERKSDKTQPRNWQTGPSVHRRVAWFYYCLFHYWLRFLYKSWGNYQRDSSDKRRNFCSNHSCGKQMRLRRQKSWIWTRKSPRWQKWGFVHWNISKNWQGCDNNVEGYCCCNWQLPFGERQNKPTKGKEVCDTIKNKPFFCLKIFFIIFLISFKPFFHMKCKHFMSFLL